jgi:hypothetical protein
MANVASNINSDEKQKLVTIFVLGMDACTNIRNENPSSHWFFELFMPVIFIKDGAKLRRLFGKMVLTTFLF